MGDWFCSANCLFGRVIMSADQRHRYYTVGYISFITGKSLRGGSTKLLERSPKNMELVMKW